MSIISSKAEHVYKGNALMQEAYIAGATRPPTDEEIEAGAKALYDALNSVCFFSWESADRASRADYIDAMRLALKAIQGKATEE
ncbi:MAG: hypothetical protein KH250_07190 [Bifidobacterium longum]|jgi:hypothetical protein|nr:hypothetical protein [Bifidobacterium longum]